MQGVVPPEEPAQDLGHGGIPHEQSRPESPEDKAVQDLRDSLSQGSERLHVAVGGKAWAPAWSPGAPPCPPGLE